MTTTLTNPAPTMPRAEALELAERAYQRLADLVATIDDEQWDAPTDCDGWSVRDMVGHIVGAMRSAASMREMLSQQREIAARVKNDGGNQVDHMTQVQIDRTSPLTNAELVAECQALVGPATRGRRRMPAPIRRFLKIPVQMNAIDETWTAGYLNDIILTRDAWLHRIDLCRALGRDPDLDDLDRAIVADVAREWAARHGQGVELVLTGPAGGTFRFGGGGERLELDAVEFCRILSARAEGTGLLRTEVPF